MVLSRYFSRGIPPGGWRILGRDLPTARENSAQSPSCERMFLPFLTEKEAHLSFLLKTAGDAMRRLYLGLRTEDTPCPEQDGPQRQRTAADSRSVAPLLGPLWKG